MENTNKRNEEKEWAEKPEILNRSFGSTVGSSLQVLLLAAMTPFLEVTQ